ncbi:MAG: (2Fe-2S)-binding protein [Treponema sp.]|jgi:carbon-monoxide dehydrogenase small subunit|nr:(2Fe-2S)-binding protein [Treponema sp.]
MSEPTGTIQRALVRCVINGRPTETVVDVRSSLADMLRSEYRLTGVKQGCGAGECGACTVLINGESFNACIYLAVWADGKAIRTIEGLAREDGELSAVQRAFVAEGAIQCGFCTPGFVLTAEELAARNTPYTEEELRNLLSGHLCRCTGYENILKAVQRVLPSGTT